MQNDTRGRLSFWIVLVVCATFLVGCDEDATNEVSGDTTATNADATDTADGEDTSAPECPSGRYEEDICAPESPRFQDWVCPEGWTHTPALVDANGQPMEMEGVSQFMRCEPPPFIEPPTECEPGFMPRVGEAQCVRQGGVCPADGEDWPTDEELKARAQNYSGKIWFVKAGAPSGATGTRESPFGSMEIALRASNGGDIIALAKGEIAELVTVARPVAIVGACVEGTTVRAPSADETGFLLTFDGAGGALLRDLTVTGERPGVRVNAVDEAVTLKALAIQGVAGLAVQAISSGQVHLSEVFVTDTQPVISTQRYGSAVQAAPGSYVVIEDSSFMRHYEVSVGGNDAQMEIRRVLITDTKTGLTLAQGAGLAFFGGGRAEIEDLVLLRNQFISLYANQGSSVALKNAYIADTRSQIVDGSPMGTGIYLSDVSSTLEGVSLVGNACGSMILWGGSFDVRGVMIAESIICQDDAGKDKHWWGGILVVEQASGSLEGMVIKENNFWYGIYLDALDKAVSVKDVWVGDNTQKLGLGTTMLNTRDAQDVDISQALFLRNAGVGILSHRSIMRASDILVAETYSTNEEDSVYEYLYGSGSGFVLYKEGDITVERVALVGNQSSGFATLNMEGAGVVKASDLRITDTKSRDNFTTDGSGLVIARGVQAEIERLEALRNTAFGVFVISPETVLTMRDVRVSDTRMSPCAESTCPSEGAGANVAVITGATLNVENFVMTGSPWIGLAVQTDSNVTAKDGVITENLIGLNVTSSKVNITEAFLNVLLLGNNVDQDFSEITIPQVKVLFDDSDDGGLINNFP